MDGEDFETFPVNIKLEDMREAIANCKEFFEKSEDDVIIFNYRFCNSKTFPSLDTAPDKRTKLLRALKREARGLVFSKETGKVISRRYHKFFNIGELPETQPEKIDLSRPYSILTKYDGKLVTPVPTCGKIRFASKSGFGDVTKVLEERFFSLEENNKFFSFSEFWIKQNCTPIFEWCSPRNPIVLRYEADLLVLTGIRENDTGRYIKTNELIKSANEYKIPVTEIETGTVADLNNFMKQINAKCGIEGVVLRFEDDGTMYKMKTEWYFERTKKEKQDFTLNSERAVWKTILDQETDDALVYLNDPVLTQKVKEFEIVLFETITKASVRLNTIAAKYKNLERKKYVEQIKKDPEVLKEETGILFRLYDKDAFDVLLEEVKKSCSSQSSLEKARTILGGKIKFYE